MILKDQGIQQCFASVHMPHRLRDDCLQVWQQQVEELISLCSTRRHHDEVFLCCDLNYDILDIVNVDDRGVPFGELLRTLGLQHSRPSAPTWSNTTGSSSRIDFLLFSLPTMTSRDDRVLVGSDHVLGTDHCAVNDYTPLLLTSGRRPFKNSKCGKWFTHGPQLMQQANDLASKLDLSMQDLTMNDIEALCAKSSKRVTSCRYVDPPHIKAMISDRRYLHGAAAKDLSKRIIGERKKAKKEWLQYLLEQSAAGDFRAVSYFRKRKLCPSYTGVVLYARRWPQSCHLTASFVLPKEIHALGNLSEGVASSHLSCPCRSHHEPTTPLQPRNA